MPHEYHSIPITETPNINTLGVGIDGALYTMLLKEQVRCKESCGKLLISKLPKGVHHLHGSSQQYSTPARISTASTTSRSLISCRYSSPLDGQLSSSNHSLHYQSTFIGYTEATYSLLNLLKNLFFRQQLLNP